MGGAKNEVELVPILFNPRAARCAGGGIVVEFEPGEEFQVGIGGAEPVDLVEIDAIVVTVVIGEGDFLQAASACAVSPGLEKLG
jgi:hypothetical protein